ncbi:hypothetical protein FHR92_004792 [Fontibacillus solani]|uniref:Uncharacterized protein n=2 Tax=Fontibacillus solani TaxID=1572857 RepID=A0A7W3XU58_9BACL|nr:hypothetical protein [Fontibacillus solani]
MVSGAANGVASRSLCKRVESNFSGVR